MSPLPFTRRDADEALARRVARGDEAACSTLFHRYHPRLELYCRSITRNDADAQDAAQCALTKAFAALRARAPETALRPWLFRIAHNEAISLLRRRRPEGQLADELVLVQAGPAQSLELNEELRAVLADVRELPPRARQALLLRELADLDYVAVGGVLGITPGGARQAVFEARLALQADRAGREAPCEGIRQELSDCDARRRPTRRARGHLRGCSACRSWRQAQVQRRRSLALVPGASMAGGAWAWMTGLAGGGGAAGGSAGVGTKVAAGLAAVAAAGGAPVAVEHRLRVDPPAPSGAKASAGKERAASHAARARTRAAAAPVAATAPAIVRAIATTDASRSASRTAAGGSLQAGQDAADATTQDAEAPREVHERERDDAPGAPNVATPTPGDELTPSPRSALTPSARSAHRERAERSGRDTSTEHDGRPVGRRDQPPEAQDSGEESAGAPTDPAAAPSARTAQPAAAPAAEPQVRFAQAARAPDRRERGATPSPAAAAATPAPAAPAPAATPAAPASGRAAAAAG